MTNTVSIQVRRRVATVLVTIALVSIGAAAQEPQREAGSVVTLPSSSEPPPFSNLRGFSDDYQIGAGDQLDIQVVGHDDLRQTLRVLNSGEISYPLLGLVKVADLNAFEVEEEIARRLKDRDLVSDAEVMVFIREYQAKPIYVLGAVMNPGEYVMSQELTAADAVLLAGGLRFNAADEALLHRRTSGASSGVSASTVAAQPTVPRPGFEMVPIDLRPLKEGRFLESTLPLRRGDVLVVPDQHLHPFFVVGEVFDPRNFFYVPGKVLMASQAISWAGGPMPDAKMSKGMLVRYDDQGGRSERRVDFAAILSGKQPDFEIQPNDVIFIPGSRMKTIGYGLLDNADNMAMYGAFRVGRTYQLPDGATDRDRERGQIQ
jgi:polysaccharide biosynthesis/export protein